jgi:phospho-N-acetylmuramoyl-pentapeptide-transferase
MIIADIIKVILPIAFAFFFGLLLAPILSYYLYKHKLWKKESVKLTLDVREATISNMLHNDEIKKTPRMGGILVWTSVIVTTVFFYLLALLFPNHLFGKLSFFSRNQTWVPFYAMVIGSLVGLLDDFYSVNGGGTHIAGGLSLRKRLSVVALISFFCASWFYFKLDVSSINLMFGHSIELGYFFIPFFILVAVGIYSGGIIDGIDGLAGGVFMLIFSAYAGIAFYQQQYDLASFSGVIAGSLMAFLWFNIPPARFYLSETGTMGLTIVLTVIAFTTDTLGGGHGVLVLPIIAILLVVTSLSAILQIGSKKLRGGKKIFLVAPIHNHFQAIGWPGYKVTMRYWIIGIIFAIIGLIIALLGK